jgi:hypothetical protein
MIKFNINYKKIFLFFIFFNFILCSSYKNYIFAENHLYKPKVINFFEKKKLEESKEDRIKNIQNRIELLSKKEKLLDKKFLVLAKKISIELQKKEFQLFEINVAKNRNAKLKILCLQMKLKFIKQKISIYRKRKIFLKKELKNLLK